MERLRSDDAEIVYDIVGNGPPVVLLHPFPVHHQFWNPIVPMLNSRYRLILPDLRGHGDSEIGQGPATMGKHARDLAHLLDAVGEAKAAFVGVSIGGYILFEFWRQFRGRVNTLVLCDTKPQADASEARANRLKSASDVLEQGTDPFVESMIPKVLGRTTLSARPDLLDGAPDDEQNVSGGCEPSATGDGGAARLGCRPEDNQRAHVNCDRRGRHPRHPCRRGVDAAAHFRQPIEDHSEGRTLHAVGAAGGGGPFAAAVHGCDRDRQLRIDLARLC
jgi:pimeloyl-ACP methyl ester carboxylesterase